MRAARGVYEEKGVENTNFRDIAEAAGVSRSTVFNYFAGSSELLTALCGKEIDDLEEAYHETVSYTHLDVYKRQTHGSLLSHPAKSHCRDSPCGLPGEKCAFPGKSTE